MPAPSSSSPLSFLCFLTLLLIFHTPSKCASAAAAAPKQAPARRHRLLSVDYYDKTCPHLEQLVSSITTQQFRDAPVSAPATLRLFFHDCFVEVRENWNPLPHIQNHTLYTACIVQSISITWVLLFWSWEALENGRAVMGRFWYRRSLAAKWRRRRMRRTTRGWERKGLKASRRPRRWLRASAPVLCLVLTSSQLQPEILSIWWEPFSWFKEIWAIFCTQTAHIRKF